MALYRRSAVTGGIFFLFLWAFLTKAEALEFEGRIQASNGGIKNAVVYFLDEGLRTNAAGNPVAVLDQKDYDFEPHVLIVLPGQSFLIKNSDPQAHDVRIFEGPQMIFRAEMSAGMPPLSKRLDQPGIYTVRCGVHHRMHSYVVPAANSFYALTDAGGNIRIADLKPGHHTLRIWQEDLGQVDLPLELKDSRSHFSYTFQNKNNP